MCRVTVECRAALSVVKPVRSVGTGTVVGPISVKRGGTIGGRVSRPPKSQQRQREFPSGSNFDVEINGTTVGTQYDQLNVTGTVTLGSATLNLTGTQYAGGRRSQFTDRRK